MQPESTQINPITPRANSKCISLDGHYYLVGGMTAMDISSQIYQFIVKQVDQTLKVQWKKLDFKQNVFKNTNSFAACGVPAFKDHGNRIYIWGGLQSSEYQQKCKSSLIQIDIDKREMKVLKVKEQIKIHSSSLLYEPSEKGGKLIGFGGTDQNSTLGCYLYTLDLEDNPDNEYQWKKTILLAKQHKGFLWQHSAHLTNESLFDQSQGNYLVTVGGCRYPNSPYPYIIEFDLDQNKQKNSIEMKYGLVSHDSVITHQNGHPQLLIFGGSNGGDFNGTIIKLSKGQLSYKEAHSAVGCAVAQTQKAFIVIGGVCGPMEINGVVIYKKQKND